MPKTVIYRYWPCTRSNLHQNLLMNLIEASLYGKPFLLIKKNKVKIF